MKILSALHELRGRLAELPEELWRAERAFARNLFAAFERIHHHGEELTARGLERLLAMARTLDRISGHEAFAAPDEEKAREAAKRAYQYLSNLKEA